MAPAPGKAHFEVHAISSLCLETPNAKHPTPKSLLSCPEMKLGSTSKELILAHPCVTMAHTSSPNKYPPGELPSQQAPDRKNLTEEKENGAKTWKKLTLRPCTWAKSIIGVEWERDDS